MTKGRMVEHHVKYKELHGVDETVWLTKSEHVALHNRLRREGDCNIPVADLRIIAKAAHRRTEKSIKSCKSDKVRQQHSEYKKQNMRYINFRKPMMTNVRFHEQIVYNLKTNTASYSARFLASSGKQLFYVDVQR